MNGELNWFEEAAGLRNSQAEARLSFLLDALGHEMRKKPGYGSLDGRDAVHLYLIKTHHWLPRDVVSMSDEHMKLALTEELAALKLSPEARAAFDAIAPPGSSSQNPQLGKAPPPAG